MNPCEFCGSLNTQKSHLSPLGFIKMNRSKGFSEYEVFWYCEEHYVNNVTGFWNKLKDKLPDIGGAYMDD